MPKLVELLDKEEDEKWGVWRTCVVEKSLHVLANVACHTLGKRECVDHQALLKASRFLSSKQVLESQHSSSLMMGCTILKEAKLQMLESDALLLAVQVLSRENTDQWVRNNLMQTLVNLADLPASFLKTTHFLAVLDREHRITTEVFGTRCLRAYHNLIPKLSQYTDLLSSAQFEDDN